MSLAKLKLPVAGLAVLGLVLAGCASESSSRGPQKDSAADTVANVINADGGNALDVLTGGYPDNVEACMGKSSLTPIVVDNTTGTSQSLTWTMTKGAAQQVHIYTDKTAIACGGQISEDLSGSISLPPNATSYVYAAAGGGAHGPSAEYPGDTISIGLDSNDPGTLTIHLTGDNGFKNFVLSGSGPALISKGELVQLGSFQCNTSGSGAPVAADNVFLPQTYGLNQPICARVSGINLAGS